MPRIIVFGSPDWTDLDSLVDALLSAWKHVGKPDSPTLVTAGCPTGAERMAEDLWTMWGWSTMRYPHGQYERALSKGGDACLAFPTRDPSQSLVNAVRAASEAGIPTRIISPALPQESP